jgi:voltage-gated potassium channel
MLLTTMGTEFWPSTVEGRLLCFLLALYGFGMFGYITASFASFFVERDAASPEGSTAGSSEIAALRGEIAALRATILGTPAEAAAALGSPLPVASPAMGKGDAGASGR